jgi:hypothetical protein
MDATHTLCTRCVLPEVLVAAADRENRRHTRPLLIDIDPAGAMVLLGFLQLAMRHPGIRSVVPRSDGYILRFASALHESIAMMGPASSEIAFRGWKGTGVDPAVSLTSLAPGP